MDGFSDWLALGWTWMLSQIGGYSRLLALLLLAVFATGTSACIARHVRKWRDARRERAVPQEPEQEQDEWDVEGIIAAAKFHLGLCEEVGKDESL